MDVHEIFSFLGMALGGVVLSRAFRPYFTTSDFVTYVLFILIVGNISSISFGFLNNYLSIGVWKGGESFFGGLLIVPTAIAIYIKTHPQKDSVFTLTALSIGIGMQLGKLGCLLGHPACYGSETTLSWGIDIYNNGSRLHPLPAYDMLYQAFLVSILMFVFLKFQKKNIGVGWVGLTTLFDFCLEFLKRSTHVICGLTFPQVVYIVILLITIPVLYRNLKE